MNNIICVFKSYILKNYNVTLTDKDITNIKFILHTNQSDLQVFIENVQEIIKKYDLKLKSRKREKVEMRYYLYFLLREKKLSLNQIGALFNLNHSTIVAGLKKHAIFSEMKYDTYLHAMNIINEDLKKYQNP